MALFNLTNNRNTTIVITDELFRTSNVNIHIDTLALTISEITITEQQGLGNL